MRQGSRAKGPLRVLHVVGGMDRGGAETWLMNVLRHTDQARFKMDFLAHTNRKCAYDDEIHLLGSQVLHCTDPRKPWRYGRRLLRLLSDRGPYEVVHSHVHHFSGYVLRLASDAGVPVRIAHSHTDTRVTWKQSGFLRHGYLRVMRVLIRRYATLGLAASRGAAECLFGENWSRDSRWRISYCSVDLDPFRAAVDRSAIRRELGLPPDAFVIGHVGRFQAQKNHGFLIDLAAVATKLRPRVYLLLIGDGPLRTLVERKAEQVGLSDRVVFAGARGDVARLMVGAMDVFVFPSLYEGLGIALIEAQAAGLRTFLSDAVPEEADVVKPLIRRLSLAVGPTAWAEAVISATPTEPAFERLEALRQVEATAFNIKTGIKALEGLYRAGLEQHEQRNA